MDCWILFNALVTLSFYHYACIHPKLTILYQTTRKFPERDNYFSPMHRVGAEANATNTVLKGQLKLHFQCAIFIDIFYTQRVALS